VTAWFVQALSARSPLKAEEEEVVVVFLKQARRARPVQSLKALVVSAGSTEVKGTVVAAAIVVEVFLKREAQAV
jgi:hypothetical protein